jgi:hypothetical protein
MPVSTPARFVTEVSPVEGTSDPNQTLWISEAGELTQFGAFIEALQPGCRSSIKHWQSADDEIGCLRRRATPLGKNEPGACRGSAIVRSREPGSTSRTAHGSRPTRPLQLSYSSATTRLTPVARA